MFSFLCFILFSPFHPACSSICSPHHNSTGSYEVYYTEEHISCCLQWAKFCASWSQQNKLWQKVTFLNTGRTSNQFRWHVTTGSASKGESSQIFLNNFSLFVHLLDGSELKCTLCMQTSTSECLHKLRKELAPHMSFWWQHHIRN